MFLCNVDGVYLRSVRQSSVILKLKVNCVGTSFLSVHAVQTILEFTSKQLISYIYGVSDFEF